MPAFALGRRRWSTVASAWVALQVFVLQKSCDGVISPFNEPTSLSAHDVSTSSSNLTFDSCTNSWNGKNSNSQETSNECLSIVTNQRNHQVANRNINEKWNGRGYAKKSQILTRHTLRQVEAFPFFFRIAKQKISFFVFYGFVMAGIRVARRSQSCLGGIQRVFFCQDLKICTTV